ncbi:hypothetical protein [Cryptosporangium sp. NPDC051539]|uniref:hypothetical protein n=1 Tax=Cryptosporangium sp. NPDC051539 TaxID=3363962 RepID=UPI00379980D4
MASPTIALDVASVVIKGAFNPAIFSPQWFIANDLLGPDEGADPVLDAITPQFAVFSIGWLKFQAVPDTLQIQTESLDDTEQLRDLAIAILRTLPHTPLSALGINRNLHFDAGSRKRQNRIGDLLAPKKVWSSVLVHPAMLSTSIIGARRDGAFGGSVTVTVEPAPRMESGVHVSTNDHYDLTRDSRVPTSRDQIKVPQLNEPRTGLTSVAVEILRDRWTASRLAADEIVAAISALGDR